MPEKFTLKWNDVGVANSFRKLRNAEDFYDVTLVSDDQQQVSAHKIVLAAASGYFENILKKNKHSHPLLCLDGIAVTELRNIVDYIYNGELEIYQDYLDTFLQVAHRFQIEGLMQKEDILLQSETAEEEYFVQLEDDFNDETTTVKNAGIVEEGKSRSDIARRKHTKVHLEFDTMEELNRQLEGMIEKENYGSGIIGLKCKPCGKPCRNMSDALEHVEIHVEGLVYDCKYCSKPVPTRSVKRTHERKCKANDREVSNELHPYQKTKVHLKFDTIEELDRKLDEMIEREEYESGLKGCWKCKQCGKPSKSKSHALDHVEIHIEGLVFHCIHCSKPVPTRTGKRVHELKCKAMTLGHQQRGIK